MKAAEVKFALAEQVCGGGRWASSFSSAGRTPEPTDATASPAVALQLSEQLRLYEEELAYARIAETRPLYLAARRAVLSAPKTKRAAPVSRSYADLVESVARTHDIDPDFLHAIMFVESRANPRAVSHAGARGLMQVMPATARRFGVRQPLTELHDPLTNLNVSAVYLKKLQKLFGNDLKLVLAGYNAGEGAVLKYGRKVPPYRETQGYVTNVLARYGLLRGASISP